MGMTLDEFGHVYTGKFKAKHAKAQPECDKATCPFDLLLKMYAEKFKLSEMENKVGLRIVPTYSCNKRCMFCYQKSFDERVLEPTALRSILLKLRDGLGFNPAYITIQGGEVAQSDLEKEMKALFVIIEEVFPFTQKSLTTNGDGNYSFYHDLHNYGINNITFSLQSTSDKHFNTLRDLAKMPYTTVRVNKYLDLPLMKGGHQAYIELLTECVDNDIPLTFCCDIVNKVNGDEVLDTFIGFVQEFTGYSIKTVNHFTNFIKVEINKPLGLWNKTFPVYLSTHTQKDFKKDNWIILPGGSLTDDFNDVIVGRI